MLQVLLSAGLSETDAARAMGTTCKKLMAMGERLFRSLPEAEFPALTRLAGRLMEDDPEALFDYGLELMLDGLERRRPKKATARPSRAARR